MLVFNGENDKPIAINANMVFCFTPNGSKYTIMHFSNDSTLAVHEKFDDVLAKFKEFYGK